MIVFFFCRADKDEVQVLISILQEYEKASGQTIHLDKSALFSLAKIPHQDVGDEPVNLLGILYEGRHIPRM